MAELMRLYGPQSTGDQRKDEAAIAFVFCSRRSIRFASIDADDFRALVWFSTPVSSTAVVRAGARLAQERIEQITRTSPERFGVLFDSWSSFGSHILGVMAVCPVGDKARYELRALRPLKPVFPATAPENGGE